MNINDIENSARTVIRLLGEYHNAPQQEMAIDPALYAFLRGRFETVKRQHRVYVYGSDRPKRIDFRYGGNNPVVIEFATRPPNGGVELYGSQNVSELRKLCRVSRTEARLRVLLLLDFSRAPINQEAIEPTYKPINAGPGRFERNSVRVIYVHKDLTYNFCWKPH